MVDERSPGGPEYGLSSMSSTLPVDHPGPPRTPPAPPGNHLHLPDDLPATSQGPPGNLPAKSGKIEIDREGVWEGRREGLFSVSPRYC